MRMIISCMITLVKLEMAEKAQTQALFSSKMQKINQNRIENTIYILEMN